MSIDMSQFHQVFFEESFEGLDDMESGLLELNLGEPDVEMINTIFRAAHSIKGGSGTFGFKQITDFTHVMETLLDEIRGGQRSITQEAVSLLLESVDCLREMLGAERDKTDIDTERVSALQADLEKLLNNGSESSDIDAVANVADSGASTGGGWQIKFSPYPDLMKTGNDPLRIIRELSELGEIEVSANTDSIPPFGEYQADEVYLIWDIKLSGDITKEQITEIFEWVEDDCDLELTEIENKTEEVSTVPQEAEQAPPRSGVDRRSGEDRRQEQKAFSGPDRRVNANERRTGKDRRGGPDTTSIRVSIDKVDALINMVGELVITQSMLSQFGENFEMKNLEKLRDGLSLLERNTRELQENVMQIRMLPISFSFNRFPRLVHDLSTKLGKKIELKMSGEQTELDKTVMEKIGDPLVHLVRNSLDHGIEMPEVRKAAGKPETGVLHLNAYHEGGNIVIEIVDDGAGLNKERILAKARENGLVGPDEDVPQSKVNELIFMAGFSTAQEVSDVSGRGVGMDVVKRNIKDLGGVVEVRSREGEGSTFTIRLPLTLAILDGQLVRVGQQIYIIPLISIVESLQVQPAQFNSIAGKGELYRLRDDYIPIIRLYETFDIEPDSTELSHGLLVVVEAEGQKAGLFVDDLLAQQQVVIKSLETNYQKVEGVSGATILGDGTVAMIMDISGLISLSHSSRGRNKLHLVDNSNSKAA